MSITIRNEIESDKLYVEAMTRYSFWNVYKPGCDEHVMVDKLRKSDEFIPELDFVAEADGVVVGNVIGSAAKIVDEQGKVVEDSRMVVIGPICVLPEWRRQGIGALLMEQVKKTARELHYKGLVLYGNPYYYHRFGFLNAKTYNITTPEGTNMEDFMVMELDKDSLKGVSGKCYESEGFVISKEELKQFERRFLYQEGTPDKKYLNLDYSHIKQEFANSGIKFPLKEEECVGLTEDELMEMNPCGTYCGTCDDYGVVCDGCRNRDGRPIWYDLYCKQEPCRHYTCSQSNAYHDCSQCNKLPCSEYFKYPDPNMDDATKQMWFKLRMENFYHMNCAHKVEVMNSYVENEKRYLKEN